MRPGQPYAKSMVMAGQDVAEPGNARAEWHQAGQSGGREIKSRAG